MTYQTNRYKLPILSFFVFFVYRVAEKTKRTQILLWTLGSRLWTIYAKQSQNYKTEPIFTLDYQITKRTQT